MCIIYVHVIKACLKVTIAMLFFFAIRKMLWKTFLIPFLYILEKSFLVNKYKNQMCYKENKSLFFDVMKKGQIFPGNVCHFQYDYRFFLVEKWGTLERARRYTCRNLLNLDCLDSCSKMKNHLERFSSSHLLQSILIETFSI